MTAYNKLLQINKKIEVFMSKNIRDYISSNQSSSNANELPVEVKGTVDKFSRMSESQLLSEMKNLAFQGKNDGSINEQSLKDFYTQMSPMLTADQRNKLKSLINSIR